jgi:predicted PurR-regulated permease PerM
MIWTKALGRRPSSTEPVTPWRPGGRSETGSVSLDARRTQVSCATAPGAADVEGSVTDLKIEQGRDAEVIPRAGMSSRREELVPRFTLADALTVLCVALGAFVLWRTSSSLLIIFAGILLASFLDSCTRALGRVLRIGRVWRLSLVILALTVLIAFGTIWGARKVPEQASFLFRVMDTQLEALQQRMLAFGVDLFGAEGSRDLSRWFPDHDKLFGHAQTAVGTTASVLANTLVVVFLGLIFSFHPRTYCEGLVLLVRPSSRQRAIAVLDEMGSVLRSWLVGQLVRIVLMGVCVWLALYLLGIPGAFLLGVQAGASNFIPYLGPIVAGVPVALVAMPLGVSKLIWAVGIYTAIQSVEGYVIGPLIQRRAAQLSPAWTLVAIILLGSLFGVMGIALALPLFAVGRVAILRLYVEDWLGDDLNRPFVHSAPG